MKLFEKEKNSSEVLSQDWHEKTMDRPCYLNKRIYRGRNRLRNGYRQGRRSSTQEDIWKRDRTILRKGREAKLTELLKQHIMFAVGLIAAAKFRQTGKVPIYRSKVDPECVRHCDLLELCKSELAKGGSP